MDKIKASLYFAYHNRGTTKILYIKRTFNISKGTHRLEIPIPVNSRQLNSIQIDIKDFQSNDDNYILRFDDVFFRMKREQE